VTVLLFAFGKPQNLNVTDEHVVMTSPLARTLVACAPAENSPQSTSTSERAAPRSAKRELRPPEPPATPSR